MITTRFASLFALPVLSAGIIGGAALGLAATAHADRGAASSASMTSSDDDATTSGDDGSTVRSSFMATPGDYASPAPNLVPWAQWVNEGTNSQNMYAAVIGTDSNP